MPGGRQPVDAGKSRMLLHMHESTHQRGSGESRQSLSGGKGGRHSLGGIKDRQGWGMWKRAVYSGEGETEQDQGSKKLLVQLHIPAEPSEAMCALWTLEPGGTP